MAEEHIDHIVNLVTEAVAPTRAPPKLLELMTNCSERLPKRLRLNDFGEQPAASSLRSNVMTEVVGRSPGRVIGPSSSVPAT